MARHSLVCHMLTCALAALLVCGAPAKAAPISEAAITAEGTSNKSGTLEIGKIEYDLVNTMHTEFPSTDTQPYTSTEGGKEAEMGTTLSPMTIEEMALAEVAVVVAKLATTAAAELEDRDKVEDGYREQISRRAKKDRKEVFARGLANVGASLEDVTVDNRGFVAATTFRTSLPHQIDTTTTTTPMSPTTSTPIASSIATESPAILGELVRAAVAANEILAAALNVATMAVPNINITTPTTKVDVANLTTITAVANQAQLNDSEVLLETTEMNAWQHNNVENIEVTSAISDYTILPQEKKNEALKNNPEEEAILSAEANDENLPAKELESIRQHQTTTPVNIQETTTESIAISADEETTNLSNMESVLSPSRNLTHMDHEVSESMIVEKRKESQQTLALPPPSSDKDFGNVTPGSTNLVINTTDNIATQTEPVAESTTFVASFTTEKVNETTEIEGLKQVQKDESLRESGENASELAVRTTTTESLETLIAVESEARLPNKVDFSSDKESLETITTTSELTTIEDSSSNKLSIASSSIWSTNETTTISTNENLTTETSTNQQITYTTIAPKLVITTTGSLEEDMITTESPDVKTNILKMYNIAVTERSKMLMDDIKQTTISSSPTYTSNSITETSQTEHPLLETTTGSAEELFTSFDKEEKTTQNSLETIETTTKFIEEEITRTGIPLEENISTQSEISHPTEASTIQADFEVFPNAQPTEMSQQTSTEDITILNNNPETTTPTNKALARQQSEFDDSKRFTSAEILKTLLATTEKELSTHTTENKMDSEDVAESETSTAATTMIAIEEQPHHTSTVKEQLQQQRVVDESDSATITTNSAAATEESTVENVDIATTTNTADIIPTTTSIMPKLDVTTIILSTTPETDGTTTTTATTTTLSPMSLIIAEHEARSLDKTPPRLSRFVNEDGVEVLTGYSIVHQMHAGALAALLAAGA